MFECFFFCGTSASAVIRKAVTSAVGAASSSGVRKTSIGSSLGTWSSYKGKMHKIKSQGDSLSEQNRLSTSKPIEGKFTNPSGKQFFVNVYTKTSDEGLEVNYVKSVDGEEMVVTSIGGGRYIRSLATVEEIELLDKKKSGLLKTGIDTLGRYNLVVVSDGNSGGEVAYQINNGTWRSVYRDNTGSGKKSGENGNIYLEQQVDINKFSDHIKNKLFEYIEEIISSSSTEGFDAPKTGK